MHYLNSSKISVLESTGISGYKLMNTSKNELVELNMEAGTAMQEHALPIKVLFYVINGEGQLKVESEEFVAKKGDVLEVEPNKKRYWKNSGKDILQILVIKEQE